VITLTLASGSARTLHANSDLTPGAAWTHGCSTSISGGTKKLVLQPYWSFLSENGTFGVID
jgi:hypothetical protein